MRVAVTGGVAEGKSTILAGIRELGYRVVSSDELAAQLRADPAVQEEIARAVGLGLPLDRAQVRRAILESERNRRRLNAILHPRILSLAEAAEADFQEVPLLYETAGQWRFDEVWAVTCGALHQRARLRGRGLSEEEIERLLASQFPSSAKVALANRVFRTDGPREDVLQAVREAVNDLHKRALQG